MESSYEEVAMIIHKIEKGGGEKMKIKMKSKIRKVRMLGGFRKCRFCGYMGVGWPDSGECPSCGEVN